jgi:hypothetical protein
MAPVAFWATLGRQREKHTKPASRKLLYILASRYIEIDFVAYCNDLILSANIKLQPTILVKWKVLANEKKTAVAHRNLGGVPYKGLRVDSRTISSGITLWWNADIALFSSTALIPSITIPAATAPISSIGCRIVVSAGV